MAGTITEQAEEAAILATSATDAIDQLSALSAVLRARSASAHEILGRDLAEPTLATLADVHSKLDIAVGVLSDFRAKAVDLSSRLNGAIETFRGR